ncbi:sigma factor [Cellulomonas sp. HZM]|uniref:sigma factor n=1 Tax=Cellulomonas sp. HZM TaxID=1454010 RepID=UPI00068BA85C|nr:sigma factor [Cellulomonas sp. HZM]
MAWDEMLERVVRERYPRLLSHATLLTGSAAHAQDLVQDALVATFGGRARFASVAQAEQYVRRAVASRFVDEGRRRVRERALAERVASFAVPTVEIEPTGLARELVDALGLSEGAVKRYTSDGLAALDALLGTTSTAETVPVNDRAARSEVRDA